MSDLLNTDGGLLIMILLDVEFRKERFTKGTSSRGGGVYAYAGFQAG